jgi:hypothetical protein
MRFEALYIIRPAEALKERLRQAGPDIGDVLGRPLLWTKKEGGRTAWTDDDYVAQVKLLFLLNLWSDYVVGAGEDQSLKTFLQEAMGEPPFGEEVFDRWWTVERFDGADESFEEAEERLTLAHPHLLANSVLPRVEAWLSGLEKQLHP